MSQLPLDRREDCGCHAHNNPSDEQGVDGNLNQPTLLDHVLPSYRRVAGAVPLRMIDAAASGLLTGSAPLHRERESP